MPVRCDYCNGHAKLVNGGKLYPHRPDLKRLLFWHCAACSAWVGVHRGTQRPLGRLATAQLRRLKMLAHGAFDPIWKSKLKTRSEAYSWLAEAMGLTKDETHIGLFDEDQCRKVAELANAFMREARRGTRG